MLTETKRLSNILVTGTIVTQMKWKHTRCEWYLINQFLVSEILKTGIHFLTLEWLILLAREAHRTDLKKK